MGTRSLTYVYIENTPVVCMYRQFDGYPTGHGQEMAEFINQFTIVNGLGLNENRMVANGMGCLAAQMIAHFKTEPGQFYLYPVKQNQSCGQEYEYHLHENKVKIVETNSSGAALFEGTWAEFKEYCSVERYEEVTQ